MIAVLTPAARPRGPNPSAAAERARHALERQAAAERAYERERELALDRERELALDREREAAAIVELLRPLPSPPPPLPAASLWPPGIRRPTRGRRYRRRP